MPKDTANVEALTAEALANLRTAGVQVESVGSPDYPILVVHGSFYASERLLDPEFLRGLASRLASELLVAAAPVKGELWVASALRPAEHVGRFAAVIRKRAADAPPNQRLSPELFLIQDGKPVGYARTPPAPEEPPKKKSFWARLFGG
jgi:hypothetical protein